MKKSSCASARRHSPLPLRLLHGIVFGGFTLLCLVAGWPEVEHLVRTQLQPFHGGPPPRLAPLVAVLAAVVGMTVVLVQAVRGHGARLHGSGLILGALVLATSGNREGRVTGRTADSANLKILQATRTLHGRTVNELQAHGAVPEDVGTWQASLERVTQGQPTPVRTRSFEPLPFRLQKVDSPEALPTEAPPGTLLLHVMEGGAAYELHPVGISPSGEPVRLREPGGEPLVFRGLFNPDLPPLPAAGEHTAH
jgi:hypothetical protein